MPQSDLLPLEQAIDKIKLYFNTISSEDVFLQDALGRCLAEPVISKLDNPKYNVSSMDGYAINYQKFINNNGLTQLKIIGESAAGNPFKGKISNNETVRIFTGAKIPDGCDTVIIQEDVNISPDKKYISTSVEIVKHQHVRIKGLDLKENKKIFSKGTIIT